MPVGFPPRARRLSARAGRALLAGLAAAVAVGVAAVALLPDATLTVHCRHDFRKGEIAVAVDGEVVLSEALSGTVTRRWLGMLERTGGTYTGSTSVGPGRRTVEVRLKAPGYDRARRIEGEFRRGETAVLAVDSGRDLVLSWRPPDPSRDGQEPARAAAADGSPLFRHASSILFTILGSIVSASIGVYVQDFLRARKARKAEMAAAATQPRK